MIAINAPSNGRMDHDRHYDNRCRSGDFLPGRLPRGNFILFSFLRKWTGGSAQRVNGDVVRDGLKTCGNWRCGSPD